MCRDNRKAYVKAAKLLSKLEKPIYLGEVNAEDNFDIKTRYNVTKYPTYMAVYSFGHEPEKLDPVCTDVYPFMGGSEPRRALAKLAMSHHGQDLTEVTSLEFLEVLDTSISGYTLGAFETKEVIVTCGVERSATSLTPTSSCPEASRAPFSSTPCLLWCAWP